ncbi:NAD-dependent deacetylase sirtuin-5 [Lecanosticta acicola]|uniref:NAD-dependent deacetylase sirtuin-5 n=1 Tax=Lecanosticta acicola TaxID=111012 RepID=A0AAI8YRB8_9PEZI|nr:NAD-dependent deacetylase sirtuin-5 [Lecanosticta acicola]
MASINMRKGDVTELIEYMRSCESIMAVVGAGLSAPSGIPTFRHEGANWRGLPIALLSQSSTWEKDPVLMWAYTENRRQMCRVAQPNTGHRALAALARAKPDFLTITQNIDGLSHRAQHPPRQLVTLHGSNHGIKCSNKDCNYTAENYTDQSTVPGLEMPAEFSDSTIPLPQIDRQAIPRCPSCKSAMLRPGVTWFGESLPSTSMTHIDGWLDAHEDVNLLLIIGTSRSPFVADAIERGARTAVFNMGNDAEPCDDDDWVLDGDASQTLPYVIERALGTHI